MVTKCYVLYDSKAVVFGTPFFMPNRQMAMRAFSDLARDPKTLVSRHPEDFTLYEIGEFDDANGTLMGREHESMGNAVGYKNPLAELPLFGRNGEEKVEVK